MSACCVYAIVGPDADVTRLSDAGGVGELAMVRCRDLGAITGSVPDERAKPTLQAVLRHEAIVEAVHRQGHALPVRFGTVFRNAMSVASAIAERYEPLREDLERVGGRVEMSVTALWTTPPEPHVSDPAPALDLPAGQRPGLRYLQRRAAELQGSDALRERARRVADELSGEFASGPDERRVSLIPSPGIAMRAAYLMDAAQVAAFKDAFDAVRRRRQDVRLALGGPWPPYSFVRKSGKDGDATGDGRIAELAHVVAETMWGRLG
jgi:hypothetical protein